MMKFITVLTALLSLSFAPIAAANDFISCQQQQTVNTKSEISCSTENAKENLPETERLSNEYVSPFFINQPNANFPQHTQQNLFSKSIQLPTKKNIAAVTPNSNT